MPEPQDLTEQEYALPDLARAAQMTERNVRAYQARGLLPPPRRRSRRVVYGPEHLARLRLVQALAGHGLSLRVIADLVARGSADDELARLAREELSSDWVPAGSVSMSGDGVRRFDEANPGVVDSLVEAGLMERHGDDLLANATALGLTSSLVARGVGYEVCARVGLAGARAAQACRDAVADLVEDSLGRLPDDAASDAEVRRLAVQLASVAFADSLTRRVVGPRLAGGEGTAEGQA